MQKFEMMKKRNYWWKCKEKPFEKINAYILEKENKYVCNILDCIFQEENTNWGLSNITILDKMNNYGWKWGGEG